MNEQICAAIRNEIVLELRYHDYSRLVEPYVYGRSRAGDELLRCYQVAGGSVSSERRGWKLLRVEEIAVFQPTQTSFEPRRIQYNPEDRAIREVFCRLELDAGPLREPRGEQRARQEPPAG